MTARESRAALFTTDPHPPSSRYLLTTVGTPCGSRKPTSVYAGA
jgi:hypothetical protein